MDVVTARQAFSDLRPLLFSQLAVQHIYNTLKYAWISPGVALSRTTCTDSRRNHNRVMSIKTLTMLMSLGGIAILTMKKFHITFFSDAEILNQQKIWTTVAPVL